VICGFLYLPGRSWAASAREVEHVPANRKPRDMPTSENIREDLGMFFSVSRRFRRR
jgi:hypothetical protein